MQFSPASLPVQLQKNARIHFIGIGGAGMSGIAHVAAQRGFIVTGSDLKESRYTKQLQQEHIQVIIGHSAQNIIDVKPDVVVVSTAIPHKNEEYQQALTQNIPIWHRAQMLAALASQSKLIAVAGTHGKTTTSSMAACMFESLDAHPSYMIGGQILGVESNAHQGSGDIFVCEADESDASFLCLTPYISIVTNIELDHLDHWKDIHEIRKAFGQFIQQTHPDGAVIVCGDDDELVSLARAHHSHVITYGFKSTNDVICTPCGHAQQHEFLTYTPQHDGSLLSTWLHQQHTTTWEQSRPFGFTDKTSPWYKKMPRPAFSSSCHISFKGERITLTVPCNPGTHNFLNATAVLVAAHVMGYSLNAACQALKSFLGVHKRFDYLGCTDHCAHIYDDYGHHPTEIAATLKAARMLVRSADARRLIVLFQPHRYSRTQFLAQEFGSAFSDADHVIFADVYAAGEAPIPGVTGKTLVRSVSAAQELSSLAYFPDRRHICAYLESILRDGDILFTMGAGDIVSVAYELLARAQMRRTNNS